MSGYVPSSASTSATGISLAYANSHYITQLNGFSNTALTLNSNSALILNELDNAKGISIKTASTINASYIFQLPSSVGTVGYALCAADSNGTTVWNGPFLSATNISAIFLPQTTAAATYLASTTANATFLPQTTAAVTYLASTTANVTFLQATTANTVFLPSTTAAATYLASTTANVTFLQATTASAVFLTQTTAAATYFPATSAVGLAVNSASGGVSNFAWGTTQTLNSGSYNMLSGGFSNSITASALTSGVFAGASNTIGSSINTTIIGGVFNTANATSYSSSIIGGYSNTLGNFVSQSIITGGRSNQINANATTCIIDGGYLDVIDTGANICAIIGGSSSRIGKNNSNSSIIQSNSGTINDACTECGLVNAHGGVIGTSSSFSNIIGGYNCTIGNGVNYSNVMGDGVTSSANNNFTWGDGSYALNNSSGNSFQIAPSGGFTCYTNSSGSIQSIIPAGSSGLMCRGSAAIYGSLDDDPMWFYSNNIRRMILDSSGNLTMSGSGLLTVNNAALISTSLTIKGDNNNTPAQMYLYNATSATNILTLAVSTGLSQSYTLTLPATGQTIGHQILSGRNSTTLNELRFSGTFADATTTNNIYLGMSNLVTAGTSNYIVGTSNISIGSCFALIATASNNIAIGASALSGIIGGHENIAIGVQAGMQCATSVQGCIYMGYQTGINSTTVSNTVAIGNMACQNNQAHSVILGSFAVGAPAGTPGSDNVSIGYLNQGSAGSSNIGNITLGSYTGYAYSSCQYNVMIGQRVATSLITSNRNVIIGASSLHSAVNSCNDNTILGANCDIPSNTTGSICIGAWSNVNGSNKIALGSTTVALATSTPTTGTVVAATWLPVTLNGVVYYLPFSSTAP